jgi:tetratricopeptide (TPR) repeat protein
VRQALGMQRLGRLALITAHVGEVRLIAGEHAAAVAEGRRALALAEAHQERGNKVYALRLLGLAAGEASPPAIEEARGHYTEALAIAGDLGMRPLAARCHLGLGRLAARAGDGSAAAKHLTEARDAFQAMGMTFWLERLGADLNGPAVTGPAEI